MFQSLLMFLLSFFSFFFFFFNDTATTEIYTLSLHDALPISRKLFATRGLNEDHNHELKNIFKGAATTASARPGPRSEEHTSELQSRLHLVCRLLLEKKKKK